MFNDNHDISHFSELSIVAMEDFNLLERLMLISLENRMTNYHHKQLNDLAARYGVQSISTEDGYTISTEGFFDFIKGIFIKLGSWIGLTVEKTNTAVTNNTPVEVKKIVKTSEPKTYYEKLIAMSNDINYKSFERYNMHLLLNGSKDAEMLKELGDDAEVKRTKAWISKISTAWKAWNSMLIGGRPTDDESDFTLGMAIREIKLISTKGILNTDGASELLSRNFTLRKYLLVPGKFEEFQDAVIKNIHTAKDAIDEIDKYLNGSLPSEPTDVMVDMDRISNKHALIDLIGMSNKEQSNDTINDNFINDHLPKLIDKSNILLNSSKVKIDRELMATIRPLANERAATAYIKQFDSKFTEARNKSGPSETNSWNNAEKNAVRTTMRFSHKVVQDYTSLLRDVLLIQRIARNYIKFNETLAKLDI